MTQTTPLQRWHAMMDHHDMSALSDLLADDAVFHSPVVHTPQRGKEIVMLYLTAASEIFADTGFHYEREIIDGNTAVLEFSCEIDGIQINGIDMFTWNDAGLITDFKVMVRPLKAINMVWAKMGEMLETAKQRAHA